MSNRNRKQDREAKRRAKVARNVVANAVRRKRFDDYLLGLGARSAPAAAGSTSMPALKHRRAPYLLRARNDQQAIAYVSV